MKCFRWLGQFVLILIALIVFQSRLLADEKPLFVYAGAGLRPAMEKLSLLFEERERVKVRIDYGGSGQLLTRFKASQHGDLFVPGAKVYLQKLAATGEVSLIQDIVMHTPVVGIHRDKLNKIKVFSDLTKPGIRIGLGDPKSMALGRSAQSILERSGMAEAIQANTVVRAATVKQLAMYLVRGDVDVAIIGRSDVVQNSDKLTLIEISKDWYQPEIVAVGVLKTTEHAGLAKRFADLLASPEGIAAFVAVGFLPCDPITQ